MLRTAAAAGRALATARAGATPAAAAGLSALARSAPRTAAGPVVGGAAVLGAAAAAAVATGAATPAAARLGPLLAARRPSAGLHTTASAADDASAPVGYLDKSSVSERVLDVVKKFEKVGFVWWVAAGGGLTGLEGEGEGGEGMGEGWRQGAEYSRMNTGRGEGGDFSGGGQPWVVGSAPNSAGGAALVSALGAPMCLCSGGRCAAGRWMGVMWARSIGLGAVRDPDSAVLSSSLLCCFSSVWLDEPASARVPVHWRA